MSPDLFERWECIVQDVEKTKIPVEFIKKLIIKLSGRRQRTVNIKTLINQGLDNEEIENFISKKMEEYDDEMIGIEFILDIEGIANIVQPETDKILKNL